MRNVVFLAVAVAAACAPTIAHADSRADPTHVAAELANAIAQGKITVTPTPSATPKPTTAPTAQPTSAPAPIDNATATPEPGLPLAADDESGYIRPSALSDGVTVELALQAGRWNVRFEDDACAPGVWTNVVYQPGFNVNGCALSAASWGSDSPCARNENGDCDVFEDQSYWYALSQAATDTPTPAPTLEVALPRAPPVAAMPTQAPRVIYVQLPAPTVAPPTETPVPSTATPTPTATRAATATATTTRVATATSTATAIATRQATATARATATPTPAAPIVTDDPPATPMHVAVDPLSQQVPAPMLVLGVWLGVRPTGVRQWASSQP